MWITGTVKWSIQFPAEYVLVIYTSSAEALLHPFLPSQLISAMIHAAQTVPCTRATAARRGTSKSQWPASSQAGARAN